MRNRSILTAAAAGLALAVAGPAAAQSLNENVEPKWELDGDRAFVVDTQDLAKADDRDMGVPLSAVMNRGVVGNGGMPLGTVSDFFIAPEGEMYAVIDVAAGPVEEGLALRPDEILIVPLRELRVHSEM